ncbi:hypothetical protein ABT116_33250 [Streptomyces sp. NPDC002130]|uniref:hypothetical protein n=1 Tax=Streptomyces sp. NPDC002130 TaxID=3155568 RepID=UPI00332DF57F
MGRNFSAAVGGSSVPVPVPSPTRRAANLADTQANATAAQENLTEARTDAADTIAELNTELDNEPPKTTRPRRKSS